MLFALATTGFVPVVTGLYGIADYRDTAESVLGFAGSLVAVTLEAFFASAFAYFRTFILSSVRSSLSISTLIYALSFCNFSI